MLAEMAGSKRFDVDRVTGLAAPAATPAARTFSGPPSLAGALLFCGAGYALPFALFPEAYPLNGPTSPEVLNLNLLVAWMGLSHFVFAYAGQARPLRQGPASGLGSYLACLAGGALGLALARRWLGPMLFDFAVWVYFIPHFVKAELHFLAAGVERPPEAAVLYWLPALAFAFFTLALFGPAWLSERSGWLILLAAGIAAAGFLGRAREPLEDPAVAPYALLGFFLLAEGMVWGTYSKYMSPQFRQGVYSFHIAAASFYHYFRAYGFAGRRVEPPARPAYWARVAAVNAAVAALGILTLRGAPERPVHLVFGLPAFTFWVGLHLVSSDAFGRLRRASRGV